MLMRYLALYNDTVKFEASNNDMAERIIRARRRVGLAPEVEEN